MAIKNVMKQSSTVASSRWLKKVARKVDFDRHAIFEKQVTLAYLSTDV